jgi:hypothetical protein
MMGGHSRLRSVDFFQLFNRRPYEPGAPPGPGSFICSDFWFKVSFLLPGGLAPKVGFEQKVSILNQKYKQLQRLVVALLMGLVKIQRNRRKPGELRLFVRIRHIRIKVGKIQAELYKCKQGLAKASRAWITSGKRRGAEMTLRHKEIRNGYPHIEPLEISDDELREQIAKGAQEYLDMTYEEFVEAYRQGTLPDELVANELAMLLRFVEYSSGV